MMSNITDHSFYEIPQNLATKAQLSRTDALLAAVGIGIAVHLTFKKYESYEPLVVFTLLLGVPSGLTSLYLPHASTLWTAVLTIFPLFWGSILASLVAYRLSPWHPLAKYPGPLLCRVTKLYGAFMSTSGKQYTLYSKLHAQYGDVVRVGPNELSIIDPHSVQPTLGATGLAKGPFWDGRVPPNQPVKPLIAINDKQEHARRRRPWTRAFSTNALKGYEETVIKRSSQLVDLVLSQKGAGNFTDFTSYFAYDIMSDLAFGGGSEMMKAQADEQNLWHMIEASQQSATFMSHVPWLAGILFRLPFGLGDLKEFRNYARRKAAMRRTQGSTHKDIFHHLIDEDGVASERPTVAEIVSDGGLAIIAGSDTTATALAHIFYFLICNPTIYKRLQAEVDGLGNDIMDSSKQAHLPYLNAVINESLRLFPPVLTGSNRRDTSGRMLGPHFAPEGTTAIVPIYTLHRDPRNFSPAPDAFIPERWMPENVRKELEPQIFNDSAEYIHNANMFIPFSMGPANCAGKNLAYQEMRMVVCLMIQRTELKFAEGYNPTKWIDDLQDFFITVKGPLPVVATPRRAL
uniref:High nitrogen upregulated cytochrome P450 monooxygenase 2 n=1 Tax=Psilocybe cubensis TaxID=181762 RepID=A0A8H8CFT6_PSICU